MNLFTDKRNQAHKHLSVDSELEHHLNLLLHDHQFGSWVFDVSRATFNPSKNWYKLIGLQSVDLITSFEQWQARIHPLDRKKVRDALDAHIYDVAKLYECEYRIRTCRDNYTWVLDRGRATARKSSGEALQISGVTQNINDRKTLEQNENRKDYVLRNLYSILLAESIPFTEQVQKILKLGCYFLKLRCGIVSYVEGQRYNVLHVYSSSDQYKIQAGDVYDLGITYCKFTLQQRQPVGFAHAANTEITRHPSYEALKLEAYLGAPLFLNGNPFGTLNFTSIDPRQEEFTHSEKYCVQIMAEWISNKLQHQFVEKRRLETHEKLAIHQQHSPLAIIEWTTDNKVKFWSRKAATMLGWTAEQVTNKRPEDWPVIKHEDRKLLENLSAQLRINQQEDYAFECDLVTIKGESLSTEWFVAHSKLHGGDRKVIHTLVMDVTERAQAENELLFSNARYVDLYQNAPDMYFSLDEEGSILTANQFCHQMLVYEENELIGKPFWNLINKNDVRRVRRHINVALNGEVEEFELEVSMLTKSDHLIRTHQRIRIIQPSQGLPRELRILARDITEREEVKESRLLHLKKQRDEIGREVQHRIKNSLQAVVGLLKVNLDCYPELKGVLTNAISQVDTISIVNSLMMETGRTSVNLDRLVQMLIDATSRLFGVDIKLRSTMESEYEINENESIAVSLIISELLINASKYHAKNSFEDDLIIVDLMDVSKDKICLRVVNSVKRASGDENKESSRVGISMINALLPPQGAELVIDNNDTEFTVRLFLQEPVLYEIESAQLLSSNKFSSKEY